MFIAATATPYIYVPITAPVADPTTLTAELALVPQDASPATANWVTATWRAPVPGAAKELAVQRDVAVWPDGEYMCWARLHSPPELLVLPAGRVRIGDTRGQAA